MELLQLRRILLEECRLAPDRLVVVGVSGGPDSLCLLDGLHSLEIPLLAAHFDHSLRPESAQDAQRVEAIAREMGVPYSAGREDVRALAKQAGLSLEEAARKARYRFLFHEARAHQAQAVAVGHTADDQVETVLMHLLRGAGLSGLRGMVASSLLPEWDEQIPLVRPLLGVWREETEAWCAAAGLHPLMDPSNQDPIFFRNRLRHELVPYLQGYNPKVKEAIWRTARSLAADWELLAGQVELAWERCWLENGIGWVALSLADLQDLPVGLQRAVLRRVIGQLRPGLRDIDFSVVERALDWLSDPRSQRWLDLAAGLKLWVEWGRITITETQEMLVDTEWPQVLPGSPLELPVPGEVNLAAGWQLRAEWGKTGEGSFTARYTLAGKGVGRLELDCWLDADKVQLPLMVRGMSRGERLVPLGMSGHSLKLSDFFTNHKLPQRARAGWPLVVSGEQVAWAAGLRLGEQAKIEKNTSRVVHLELVKNLNLP